jgi:ankyrin repeat protein
VRVLACRAALVAVALSASSLSFGAEDPGTAFQVAIERGDLLALKALVEGGASPDTAIGSGEGASTPLAKAAWEGRREMVKYLLAKGAKVDGRDGNGETPLMQAAQRDFDDVIAVLLAAGADVRAADTRGNTAFSAAMFNAHYDVADLLLKAGADPDVTDPSGITPLMAASSVCNPESLRYLVKAGARVNRMTQLEYGGQTPLITAVITQQTDCVKTLLELGADPRQKMKDGATALSNAQEQGTPPEILALLQAAKPATSSSPPAAAAPRPRSARPSPRPARTPAPHP